MTGVKKVKKLLPDIGWYSIIVIGLLITLVPIFWVMVSSFRPNPIIFRYSLPFSMRTFLPTHLTLEPYIEIFNKGFGRALLNTIYVTGVTVFLGILITSMSGFVFARMRFPGKTLLFIVALISFMIPFEAIAIPLFIVIRQLGWMNSYQALIIPGLAHGICILLFRQFYLGVPQAFVDSARVDGATWWSIYSRIFLPMSKTAAISAGLLLFVFQWLSFLWPLIANPAGRYHVIQVAIARFAAEYAVYWNEQFAASFISTVIPVIILISLQKYYVRGLTGTEIKG